MDLPEAKASATLKFMTHNEQTSDHNAIISTGSLKLDLALGSGGLPRGCLVEIAGPPEAGKSTLCRKIASAVQRQDGLCAWVDADLSFESPVSPNDPLDFQRLFLSQPQYAEQGLDILETVLTSGAFMLVVLDSLDGLVPLAEINTPLGDPAPATPQAVFARWLPRLARRAHESGTILLITRRSETRPSRTYHKLKSNPARMALSLNASVSIQLAAARGPAEYSRLVVQVTKNQLAPFVKTSELDIIVNESINNRTGELIELAQQYRIIEPREDQYYYQSLALGSGPQAAVDFLIKHPQVIEQLEKMVRQEALTNRAHLI